MVEKIGTIKNPLTIIAMFAGIAEISGTAVLPFITEGNQGLYIWFLMIFPLLLIILFFVTLNFNHKVLYAPSDFKNEDNFFKSLTSASPLEKAEKLKEEIEEIQFENNEGIEFESEKTYETKHATQAQPEVVPDLDPRTIRRQIRVRYELAEDLILNKISNELGQVVQKDMRFSSHGRKFVFDGVVVNDGKLTAIEVKYFKSHNQITPRFRDVFLSILDAAERLPESVRKEFSLILAIATEEPSSEHETIVKRLSEYIGITPFGVDIRVFNIGDLKKEFKLNDQS